MKFMAFLLNSQAQGVSGKMNNLPKHHGAEPPKARDLMQLHRLHRLKAGPGNSTQYYITLFFVFFILNTWEFKS